MLISKYTSDKRTLLGTKGHHSDEGELSKAHCNPSVCAPNQGASEHAERDSTVGAAGDPTAGGGDISRLSVTVSWRCSNKGPQTGCLEQHKCTSHSSGGGSQVGVLAGPTRSSRGFLPGPLMSSSLCACLFS